MIFYMQLIGLEDTHSSRHKGLKGHEMIYVMAKIMKPKRRLPKFKKKNHLTLTNKQILLYKPP